jgi:hypothetical protein
MLTEAIARELMPSDELPVATYRLVFDGGTGLALRVQPSCHKGWIWQGRTPEGRMVRLGLGEWGQRGLTLAQARRLAAEVKARVRAGEDIEALRRVLKNRRAQSKLSPSRRIV